MRTPPLARRDTSVMTANGQRTSGRRSTRAVWNLVKRVSKAVWVVEFQDQGWFFHVRVVSGATMSENPRMNLQYKLQKLRNEWMASTVLRRGQAAMADSLAGSIWIQPLPTIIPRNSISNLLNSHFDNFKDSPSSRKHCRIRHAFHSLSSMESAPIARSSI